MNVLALDFDGVLCDSSRETFVVAVDAFALQEPNSPLARPLKELRDLALAGSTSHLNDPIAQAFSHLLPLGNRAEDFGVALRAVESATEIANQIQYDQFYVTHQRIWLESYHRKFYEARTILREDNPTGWLELHRPYPGLVETLREYSAEARFAVVTAKDSRSVHLLLEQLEVADLFDAEMILDKETGINKTQHLQCLKERLGIEFGDITFVDDKVNHLEKVSHLGVRPVLAGWGLNTQREHVLARKLGFEIASLDNLGSVLFKGE